jgi:ATP-dependent Zn protease
MHVSLLITVLIVLAAGVALAPVHVASAILAACGLLHLYRHRDDFKTTARQKHARALATRPFPEEVFERSVAHESGHTLTACLVGFHVTEVEVYRFEDATELGRTDKQRPYIWTEESYRSALMQLMAGRAGEVLCFGSPSAGAADDIEEATQLVLRKICQEGLDSDFGIFTYDLELTSASLSDAIMKRARGMVEDGYRCALELLKQHRPAYDRLRDALRTEHLLTHDRIKQLIEG